MRQIRLIALCLVLLASSCSLRDLDVMSFCIKPRDAADGLNSWENRKPLLLAILKEQDADIIGFQQVDNVQLLNLQLALNDYKCPLFKSIKKNDSTFYHPIFFKIDEFDLIAKSQFRLIERSSDILNVSEESHFVTWIKLRRRSSGHIFFVFNTSFSKESSTARLESAEKLIENIAMIADNAPVVVIGNFNEAIDQSAMRLLTGSCHSSPFPLRDSEEMAEVKTNESSNTHTVFNDFIKVKHDFILVNGYFDTSELVLSPNKNDGVYSSNYQPILARLRF